jgi:hypothetical protein
MSNINTAIRALNAEAEPDGSYAYLAHETRSTWVVTAEDMEALGAILEADEAYQESRERTRSDLLADNSHGDGYSVWCAQLLATERRPLTGAQAWEAYVGDQTPAEFMERSRCHDDICTAVYRYVDGAETCQGLASWEVADVRQTLVDYIVEALDDDDDVDFYDVFLLVDGARVEAAEFIRANEGTEDHDQLVLTVAEVLRSGDVMEFGGGATPVVTIEPAPPCRIYLDGSPCDLDEVVFGPREMLEAVNFLQRSDAWGVIIDMGDEGLRTLTLHDRNRPGVVR